MDYKGKFTPLQEAWLKALESGDYKQGESYLVADGGFCCLGLATHLVDENHPSLTPNELNPHVSIGQMTSDDINKKYDFVDQNLANLAEKNDGGHPFEEIAKHIRQNPERYFHNFR